MTRLGPPHRDVRSAALVVGALAVLVYANSLWNQFAYDDVQIITQNPAIEHLANLPSALLAPYWPGPMGREQSLWRPVTTTAFAVLYSVGRHAPLLFHVANVVGHAAVSVLTLLVCAALMPLPAALVAGLVFAVHPVHVEAVANVVGLAEITSALAMLLACLVFLRGPRRSGWARALGIGALYAVAFGAKESGVTLPGVIFLLDAARREISPRDLGAYLRDRWRVYAVMAAVAAVLLGMRMHILGGFGGPLPPYGADLLNEIPRIWTLGDIWTHYVRLWVFPLDLSADYSPDVIPVSFGWHASNVTGVIVMIAVLSLSLVAWRSGPMDSRSDTARAAAFGVVWFLITISPVSNVLFMSGVLLAERTLYLPSMGLAAAVGWLVVRLARDRPKPTWALLVVALSLGAVRTWTRTPAWKDNNSMFTALIRDYPQSGRSQWILGDLFLDRGRVSEGLRSYRAATVILDSHYALITHVARKLTEMERYRSAQGLFEIAWRDRPQYALAPSLVASIRAEVGDPAGTETWSRRTLAIDPDDPFRRYLLAWSLAAQGRWDEAREEHARAEATKKKPGEEAVFWQRWLYRAYMRREEGDSAGSLAAVDSAVAVVRTRKGAVALDSIRVADFGLRPLLAVADSVNK